MYSFDRDSDPELQQRCAYIIRDGRALVFQTAERGADDIDVVTDGDAAQSKLVTATDLHADRVERNVLARAVADVAQAGLQKHRTLRPLEVQHGHGSGQVFPLVFYFACPCGDFAADAHAWVQHSRET